MTSQISNDKYLLQLVYFYISTIITIIDFIFTSRIFIQKWFKSKKVADESGNAKVEKPQIDSFRYRMQVLESRLQTIDTRSQIIDNRMMRTGEEYCKDLFKCFFCNT